MAADRRELGRISDEIPEMAPIGGKLVADRLAEIQVRATIEDA